MTHYSSHFHTEKCSKLQKTLCKRRPNLRGIWCHHVFAANVCMTQHWIPPRTAIYVDPLSLHAVPKRSLIISRSTQAIPLMCTSAICNHTYTWYTCICIYIYTYIPLQYHATSTIEPQDVAAAQKTCAKFCLFCKVGIDLRHLAWTAETTTSMRSVDVWGSRNISQTSNHQRGRWKMVKQWWKMMLYSQSKQLVGDLRTSAISMAVGYFLLAGVTSICHSRYPLNAIKLLWVLLWLWIKSSYPLVSSKISGWKIPEVNVGVNRKIAYKWSIWYCNFWLPEGNPNGFYGWSSPLEIRFFCFGPAAPQLHLPDKSLRSVTGWFGLLP